MHKDESLFALWQQERELLDEEKARRPDLFVRSPMIDTPEMLRIAGIGGLGNDLPIGYLKLWPQDFIVEEIDQNGLAHTVDNGPLFRDEVPASLDAGQTLYADLVKVGISTVDAVEELSRALGRDAKIIGTAGIKDRDAITSQRVSFRGSNEDELRALAFPNLFLKQAYRGKGVVERGGLGGNRFTILVRAKHRIDEGALRGLFETARKDGFWNFYYLQRFGTPRLITHLLGLLILQGAYEETVKTMMTYKSFREIPYFREVRDDLAERWGDWRAMYEIAELFPHTLRSELKMLAHLRDAPQDFLGALALLPQQVTLAVYAYASFLFNRALSEYVEEGREPPRTLPIALSKESEDRAPYEHFLAADDVRIPSQAFRDFPFVQLRRGAVPVRSQLVLHDWRVQDRLAVLEFTLQKGSYATTFLAHAFQLSTGLPVPDGIPQESVDALALLGRDTALPPLLERFGDAIVSKVEVGKGEGGDAAAE